MLMRMVLYDWPRRIAKSSTPSTSIRPAAGTGWARMSPISTSRQHGIASLAASRDPGAARQRERDISQRAGQRRGAAGERRGQPQDLLGERGLPATQVAALEAAHAHDDLHLPRAEREIGEPTLVAGVDPGRATPAARARRIAGLRPDPERHQIPTCSTLSTLAGREVWQKRINSL